MSPNNIRQATLSYQIWTKRRAGSFAVFVPNAKIALATIEEFSEHGHLDIMATDMDGNDLELEVLKAMVGREDKSDHQTRPS